MDVDESNIEPNDRSLAARRRAPRNYFSRREQYRLLSLVFTLMLVVVMMREAAKPVNWQWMWQMGASPEQSDSVASADSIDTRLNRPTSDAMPADVFLSPSVELKSVREDAGATQSWDGIAELDLAPVKDDTVFRAVESPVWYGILSALNTTTADQIEKSSVGDVGFTQLFRQTEEYRGLTVTVSGTVRRAFPLAAGNNDQGIESYWQCWLKPDGSPNPIVVYSLQMPDDFPEGMTVRERVEWDAVLYKRWAYAADEGTRTAPLMLAKQPRWAKTAPAVARPIARVQDMVLVALGALAAAVGLTWFIYYRIRSGYRISKLGVGFGLCLLIFAVNVPPAWAQDTSIETPPVQSERPVESVRQYLQLYEIGDEAMSLVSASVQNSTHNTELTLRLFQRLRRCPLPLLQSSVTPFASQDREQPPAPGDMVRVRAQLQQIQVVRVPDGLRERFGTAQYYQCQCEFQLQDQSTLTGSTDISAFKQSMTVIVEAVPKRWMEQIETLPMPQRVTFNGLVLSAFDDGAPVLASDRLEWHPEVTDEALQVAADHVLLSRYGLDVGQLDEVRSRGPLSAFDRAAFYEMLLAMGRISSVELSETAAQVNVTDLLQKSGSHRGKLYQLSGAVRRCVRILVDDDEAKKYGISSYYELVMFLDPDAIVKVRSTEKSEGRFFSTYPVVVCVRQLPEGFPEGDDIHASCSVTGSYLKLWAYPSEFMDEGRKAGEPRSLQFSPLLIGHVPTQLRSTKLSDPLGGPGIAIGFATALIMLSGLVWWWSHGDRKFKRDTLSKKYDLPSDIRIDDQEFTTIDPESMEL